MSDHHESACPMCGASDEKGCYGDCPPQEIPRLRAEVKTLTEDNLRLYELGNRWVRERAEDRKERKALRAEVERLNGESAGRLEQLLRKADEARWEWMRAEKAEGELTTLRAEVEALKFQLHGACEIYAAGHAENTTLRADVEKLRAALEPFANVTVLPNGTAVGMERHWFTVARDTLAATEQKDKEEKK